MMNIAVLLTVHNRKDYTIKCLSELFRQIESSKEAVFEVFLVDDLSTDGTPEAIRTRFPAVNLLQGDGNLFWNRGMYLAWNIASQKNFDAYIWLNDDTELSINSLDILLDSSKKTLMKNIIVGTTSSAINPIRLTYGGRIRNKNYVLMPTKGLTSCDYFNGNIVLIPKHVFNIVGFNDPIFHHSLGDFDYGLRASKLGIKSVIAPGILGYCENHESLPKWCDPVVALKKRWFFFRLPLGNNPEEMFVFERRHKGVLLACVHYLTNHLRVLLPQLWKT